jgi:hypothetical protein
VAALKLLMYHRRVTDPIPGAQMRRDLLALLIPLLLTGAAAQAEPYGLVRDDAFLRAQVVEPVFAFVFDRVEADSLGFWTHTDLEAFAAGWERPSVFPLEYLVNLRREALPPDQQIRRRGLVCDRLITMELNRERLDMPMPYDVLGYHPGTLSFGSPLVIREWRLGEQVLHVRAEEESRQTPVAGLTVFQVISGWAVLDVDAWLDKLLGKNLDDSATVSFAAGRAEGRILGVGSSVGREGRTIYGELDFRRGTVVTHGRPLARALAAASRPFGVPDSGERLDLWVPYLAATADD